MELVPRECRGCKRRLNGQDTAPRRHQLVVVFHIARSRGGKVARQLLGADFAGFLTTDRWSAYEWVDAGLRQLC